MDIIGSARTYLSGSWVPPGISMVSLSIAHMPEQRLPSMSNARLPQSGRRPKQMVITRDASNRAGYLLKLAPCDVRFTEIGRQRAPPEPVNHERSQRTQILAGHRWNRRFKLDFILFKPGVHQGQFQAVGQQRLCTEPLFKGFSRSDSLCNRRRGYSHYLLCEHQLITQSGCIRWRGGYAQVTFSLDEHPCDQLMVATAHAQANAILK